MMQALLHIVAVFLILAILLTMVRLVRGPGLADRVVALDVVAVLSAALTAVWAIQFEQRAFLDVAIILALISFVGTIAFAYYIEKRAA